MWTAVSSWVCEQCSTCDFKRLFQSEGARIQRFAENRGIDAKLGEFLDIAQIIEDNNKSDSVAFVIDDRVDVVWQARSKGIKVDGVHIGQTDMEPREARALLGEDAIVGLSAETESLVKLINELPDGCIDYIGAAPLHVSVTKPEASVGGNDGSGRTLDEEQINTICSASGFPVVVGGGVTADDMERREHSKAAGWFVVSAIAGADDPEAATRNMVARWKAVRGDTKHGYAPRVKAQKTAEINTDNTADGASGDAGISVGEDGASHQCCEDFALMRVIPGMTVICPADDVEARQVVKAAYEMDGPVYMRFARLATEVFHNEDYQFEIGKAEVIRAGSDVSIIACGLMVPEAMAAAEQLAAKGISAEVINMATIKPLDEAAVLATAKKTGKVITVEEHSIIGGLGEAVCSVLSEQLPTPVRRIGVNDEFGHSGPGADLLVQFGLCADHIAQVAADFVK